MHSHFRHENCVFVTKTLCTAERPHERFLLAHFGALRSKLQCKTAVLARQSGGFPGQSFVLAAYCQLFQERPQRPQLGEARLHHCVAPCLVSIHHNLNELFCLKFKRRSRGEFRNIVIYFHFGQIILFLGR